MTQLAPIKENDIKKDGLIRKEKLSLAQLAPLKNESLGENKNSSAEIVRKSDKNNSPGLKSDNSQNMFVEFIDRGDIRGGDSTPKLNPKSSEMKPQISEFNLKFGID